MTFEFILYLCSFRAIYDSGVDRNSEKKKKRIRIFWYWGTLSYEQRANEKKSKKIKGENEIGEDNR